MSIQTNDTRNAVPFLGSGVFWIIGFVVIIVFAWVSGNYVDRNNHTRTHLRSNSGNAQSEVMDICGPAGP